MAEQKDALAKLRGNLDAADERAKELDLYPSIEMETSYARKILDVVAAAKRFREGGGPVAMTELFAALAALEGDEKRGGR